MTSYWILQANPKLYDIDGALEVLREIRWRVPQYTGVIAPGDGVVIWRAGVNAGIVGVGRIMGPPAELTPELDDQLFDRGDSSIAGATTRVRVAVKAAPHVSKASFAAIPELSSHQIISAPMGTVFPLDDEEWEAIQHLIPELPAFSSDCESDFPPPFAWEQRGKDVYPLPGGYGGYLASLARILDEVRSSSPGREELVEWISDNLGITPTSARFSSGFLLRIGLLFEQAGVIGLGEIASRWLANRDSAPVIALLHSRARFIGELLAETREARSDTELLDLANRYFAMGWQTKAQIRRRRGWLESAGLLEETDDGLLRTTASGLALLDRLQLRSRSAAALRESPIEPGASSALLAIRKPADAPRVAALIDRLRQASIDVSDSDRFEKEVTEAFRQLGYVASWLGGSGKTDVLLEADLGRDDSYRVVVDSKATRRGAVSQAIDWDTIDEHREQHHADYAAIVAPAFGGGRLPARAERHGVVMLTVEDLAELLTQHARSPLGLDAYRQLFTSGTTEDGLAAIGEVAVEAERRAELMSVLLSLLAEHGHRMGPLSARDFTLLLGTRAELPDATEDEVAEVITALASPLIGVLARTGGDRMRPTGSPATAAGILRGLADRISPVDPSAAGSDGRP